MFIYAAKKELFEFLVKDSAKPAKQIVTHKPIGNSDSHVHSTNPIDPITRRVCCNKIQNLIAKFSGILIGREKFFSARASKRIRPSELNQMLHARKLPGHLDICAYLGAILDISTPSIFSPAKSRFKI